MIFSQNIYDLPYFCQVAVGGGGAIFLMTTKRGLFWFFLVADLKESQRERLVTSYQHKFSAVIIPRQIQNKARVGILLLIGWDWYLYTPAWVYSQPGCCWFQSFIPVLFRPNNLLIQVVFSLVLAVYDAKLLGFIWWPPSDWCKDEPTKKKKLGIDFRSIGNPGGLI